MALNPIFRSVDPQHPIPAISQSQISVPQYNPGVDAYEFFPRGGTARADASASVREHALRVFQDPDKAARWMNTRLSELDEHTPEELLASDPEAVDAVLDRLEYGVFW